MEQPPVEREEFIVPDAEYFPCPTDFQRLAWAVMPRLIIQSDADTSTTYDLTGGTVTIGRSQDNIISVDDSSMSSHHAELTEEGDRLFLKDLHSTNGTFVNEEQISTTEVNDRDQIRFGSVVAMIVNVQVHSLDDRSEEVGMAVGDGRDSRNATKLASIGIICLILLAGMSFLFLARHGSGNQHLQSSTTVRNTPATQSSEKTTNQVLSTNQAITDKEQPNPTTTPTTVKAGAENSLKMETASDPEEQDAKEAVTAVARYIQQSKLNMTRPTFGWDEPTGRIALFYHQRPQRPLTAEFLVGDIDSNNIRITAEPNVGGYSVAFLTPEDTQLISDTYAAGREGTLETTQHRAFVLWFDDDVAAEKAAHAMKFLIDHYAAKGFKTPIPHLTGVTLLETILKINDVQMTVDKDTLKLKIGSAAKGNVYENYSVLITDLDPEHFRWEQSGEHRSAVGLCCQSHEKLIERTTSYSTATQQVGVFSFYVSSEHDASRVVQLITELCKEHGWKSSRF